MINNMNTEQKVDRILQILEGDGEDQPGLKGQLAEIRRDFYGVKNELGIKTKVNIIWRAHVWLLCAISAGAGVAADNIIRRLF